MSLHPGEEAIYVEVNYEKLQKQQQVRKQPSRSHQGLTPSLLPKLLLFRKEDPEIILLSWKHETYFPLSPMRNLIYRPNLHCNLQIIFCIIFFHNMLRTNYLLSQHTHHDSLKQEEKH